MSRFQPPVMSRVGRVRAGLWGPPHVTYRWFEQRRFVLLAALLLLVPLLFALSTVGSRRSTPLTAYALAGPRSGPCVCVVKALDRSGSTREFDDASTRAAVQVLDWSAGQLTSDDRIGVIEFADTAQWRVPMRPATDRGAPSFSGITTGSTTLLQPVLDLVADLPTSECHTVLLLISDGWYEDLPATPAAAQGLLTAAGVDTVRLLVPTDSAVVPGQWSVLFGSPPVVFDGLDPDETALAVARELAWLTGQQLVPVPN